MEESPELAIEREKLQIERERLALERERLETERANYRQTVSLSNRAAGRLTIPISTLILSIVSALLLGGIVAMWIPSISSYSKGYFFVFGQITVTSAPASWSEFASCHTRRSKGTGRFSTTMQTFL